MEDNKFRQRGLGKLLYGMFNSIFYFLPILMSNSRFPSTVDKALSVLGKYSMPMWLTHTYFSVYLFSSLIYGFRYPLLIYVVLVGVSLLTARFMLRASELICNALYN